MSKKRTRHIRAMSNVDRNESLVTNMKTRKYTWVKSIAKGIEVLEGNDGLYDGNKIDGHHKEFLENVMSGKAIGYRKVVIG